MAVRLLSDGTFEFDTVPEAVEFQKMSEAQNGAPKTSKASSGIRNAAPAKMTTPPPLDIGEFMTGLEGNQKRLMEALVHADGEMTTYQLGEMTGIKRGAIGPLLRHVKDAAVRNGIARDFITSRKIPRGPGGKQVTYCVLSPETKQQILEGAQQQ